MNYEWRRKKNRASKAIVPMWIIRRRISRKHMCCARLCSRRMQITNHTNCKWVCQQQRQYGAEVYALHRLHNVIEKSFSSAINAVVIIALLIVLSVFSFCSLSLAVCVIVLFVFFVLLCSSLLYFRVCYCHIYTCTQCIGGLSRWKISFEQQHFGVNERARERACVCASVRY